MGCNKLIPTDRNELVDVFFYGLFMDQGLLATRNIVPPTAHTGYVDGFGLRIGERATLVREAGARVYGVVMSITAAEAAALYADESVADYVPEPVSVTLVDGAEVTATCYNLPADKIIGTNRVYARALLELATRLSLPLPYLDEIRQAGK